MFLPKSQKNGGGTKVQNGGLHPQKGMAYAPGQGLPVDPDSLDTPPTHHDSFCTCVFKRATHTELPAMHSAGIHQRILSTHMPPPSPTPRSSTLWALGPQSQRCPQFWSCPPICCQCSYMKRKGKAQEQQVCPPCRLECGCLAGMGGSHFWHAGPSGEN